MLTLTWKSGESIRIGDEIRIVIHKVSNRKVRIRIEAPGDVQIHREEIYLKIREENSLAAGPGAPDIEALAALVEAARRQTEGDGGQPTPEDGSSDEEFVESPRGKKSEPKKVRRNSRRSRYNDEELEASL